MPTPLEALKARLDQIHDLHMAAAILDWDQETYMPTAGTEARSRQVGTLSQMAHELSTADETGTLLEKAVPESVIDDDLLRIVRRDRDRAIRIPSDLVGEFARVTGRARDAWVVARGSNDFAHFQPHLEAVIDCNLRKAEALGWKDEPYDALLEEFEPGMTTREVTDVFADLRAALVPMVAAIRDAAPIDDSILSRYYPDDRQWSLGESMMAQIGYDFSRGRQDRSAHPFSTTFSISDSRVTTKLHSHHFSPAFFGSLHEAGHAMYEQGIATELEGTPLAEGTSLGMHESQSRLWENLVGRSRPFWKRNFGAVRDAFPATLSGVTSDEWYRAVNRVSPSLIRIEADELTYNLHIMLRFELERSMMTGDLKAADVPAAWNDRMEEYLGIRPTTDAEGCLQDIHWSHGTLGYFPTYALGNLMSAQLWGAMRRDLGHLDQHIESGDYATLLGWLREHVHAFGRRKTANQILQDATGSGLDPEPWLAYARSKFGDLYGVNLG